jgi:hypothetical protein
VPINIIDDKILVTPEWCKEIENNKTMAQKTRAIGCIHYQTGNKTYWLVSPMHPAQTDKQIIISSDGRCIHSKGSFGWAMGTPETNLHQGMGMASTMNQPRVILLEVQPQTVEEYKKMKWHNA